MPACSRDHQKSIRVLLADDHVVMREGLSRLLRDYEYIEVVGEKGMMSSPEFTIGQTMIPLTTTFGQEDHATETHAEEILVPDLYVEEITHFSACILNGQDPVSSGVNGLANQRVLDQAMVA